MNNIVAPHRYTIEVYRHPTAEHLGTVPFLPNWEPAIECAWLSALRANPHVTVVLGYPEAQVEPVWDAHLGPPFVSTLRATVMLPGRVPFTEPFPLEYFSALAQQASSDFIKSGQLVQGELFNYRVCAYPSRGPAISAGPPVKQAFSIRPTAVQLDVREQSIEDLLADSLPPWETSREVDQLPVFIPRHVLLEAKELMQAAGAKETGGLLIGHLHRDSQVPELFLEVTAQIPAQYTEQSLTKLTFTPDTWASVDRAVALRNRNELLVGWWHSHPASHWKEEEPGDGKRPRDSDRSGDFFSAADVALHSTVFPRAYSVALVVSDWPHNPRKPSVRLYGWHQGMIVARGFDVLGATNWQAPAASLARHEKGVLHAS